MFKAVAYPSPQHGAVGEVGTQTVHRVLPVPIDPADPEQWLLLGSYSKIKHGMNVCGINMIRFIGG